MNTTRALGTLFKRGFQTSALRNGGHSHFNEANAPGAYLPFQIKNRHRLAVMMVIYFGSGLGLPFFVVRTHLLRGHGPDPEPKEIDDI